MTNKRMYDVFKVETHDYGDGEVQTLRSYVGQTTAASKKQAENNVRFKMNGKTRCFADWYGDGCRSWYYEAVEVGA